ncbi:ly6/PLAUR domain-containing protein 2-like [Engystomops pustulosus]|uniref:ly6/PLAUR domain-containing protein 2-like n=1 Tax=Engystomops pustulosus TaxID=76066 RepID=UPI003AFB7BD5
MRGAAVICLVVAVLFTGPIAQGLQCFICQSPTPSLQCTTARNCTTQETWCYTTVHGPAAYPFNKNRLVVRGCAEKCNASNPNILGVTKPTYCCQDDLCNVLSKEPRVLLVTWESLVIGLSAGIALQNWG